MAGAVAESLELGIDGGTPAAVGGYFSSRRWRPFEFQVRAWEAYLRGQSGLVHAPTGVGKTLAVWMGPLIEALREGVRSNGKARVRAKRPSREQAEPLRVLWLTPMRALAADTASTLEEVARELGLGWSVELRTGDTSASVKKRQRERLPTVLVTTPESVSLLLSYPGMQEPLGTLRCVVVDEWHELIGSKRGVQTELALARLRRWAEAGGRSLRTWGLSATLGNTADAARVLAGSRAEEPVVIRGVVPKRLEVKTIIPADVERFPWAGHVGLRVLPQVLDAVERVYEKGRAEAGANGGSFGRGTTLLFTNTRAQAEIWFGQIVRAKPEWIGTVAIHHGSMDRSLRDRVEGMLKRGGARCVVCTSSLDLGVDFSPVDQVVQIGSPRGVARLVQRAGRSGHRPGAASEILGAPTHVMELIEFSAAREAVAAGRVEARVALKCPMDVLVQHLVTIGAGGGFIEEELLEEVRSTHAFGNLSDAQWGWAMDFVRGGGRALRAYPEYKRLAPDGGIGPRLVVAGDRLARQHRLNMGTIVGESVMLVKAMSGRVLGSIEESFIARLHVGDRFVFAGRVLELVRVRDMSAYARPARAKSGAVPRWNGGRMSLSTQLATGVRVRLDEARRGEFVDDEMRAVRPVLELQERWSAIPAPEELLIEDVETRDGRHWFLYPFEGRLVHEGLAAMLAYRLTKRRERSVVATSTDYGFELFSPEHEDLGERDWREVLSAEGMLEDMLACLNSTELAVRQFREIARIAGLISRGLPGQVKPTRHVQASSEMFYRVLSDFDPENLLLDQAKREVMENQLEVRRIRATLERLAGERLVIVRPRVEVGRAGMPLTPFSFPIWAESLRATHVTSESWSQRVAKMVVMLEEAACGEVKGNAGSKVRARRRRR